MGMSPDNVSCCVALCRVSDHIPDVSLYRGKARSLTSPPSTALVNASDMPVSIDDCTLLGIAALPPTTVRQIGSAQVLVDPSSVVKELIDNALDARAKSIFIGIAANTLDSIQVKDDGHGIPSEDRALACRRYCTSKIKDFQDLKTAGGKWLGFRGSALERCGDERHSSNHDASRRRASRC